MTVPKTPATEAPATQTPAGQQAAGEWQAVHIFYAASPRPLLLECVKPLVDQLTAEGLLAGYFFINYWLEGPHLRLRLKPSSPEATERVRARAEDAIAAFLRARPALYEVKAGFLADLYNTLFELEYPEEKREELLGKDGRMRLRPNNSYHWEPYEPEYGKYGGPAGVALAEWHFQRSSDLVIEAARTMNLHLRTVVLGVSAQLMMVMSGCLIPDRDALLQFLDRYHEFWNGAFDGTNYTAQDGYDRAYTAMDTRLTTRFEQIRTAVARGDTGPLPGFLRGWAEHCLELRGRVIELADAEQLVFRTWAGNKEMPVSDRGHALAMLLSPYLHMTNNRLSVTVRDEAYLSYVLGRALREPAEAEPEAAPSTSGAAPSPSAAVR
jgi:Lantibiotic biosynthesis dehydratase C-term